MMWNFHSQRRCSARSCATLPPPPLLLTSSVHPLLRSPDPATRWRSIATHIKGTSGMENKEKKPGVFIAIGIGTGIAIGTGLGVAMGNVAMGTSLGVALGVAFGALLTMLNQK